jgi:HSP20 family protein
VVAARGAGSAEDDFGVLKQEEAKMAAAQSLEVQEKRELVGKEEKTVPARYFIPATDIHETDEALTVVMEVPGVEKKDVDINLENNVIRIEGRIDAKKYDGLEPLYTEYNVGHFARSFTLSGKVDQQRIDAQLEDGVLTLTLWKAKDALPRRIEIG